MKTVVKFIKTAPDKRSDRNKVVSRTLRKVGFIDYLYPASNGMPGYDEHWEVEIVRENRNSRGGCFILKPIQKIPEDDLMPLVHGMYDLRIDEDAVILTPNDLTKAWVMSPESKRALMGDGIRALVINHGGEMWTRRKSSEDLMEGEAKKLLKGLEE